MKLAILQSDYAGLTPDQRLTRLESIAADTDADLLLCPELFLSGYAIPDQLAGLAEPSNGPSAQRIAAIARSSKTAVAYGYPERADGKPFNAMQVIAPDGTTLAHHRKSVLPPGFEPSCFQPGSGSAIFPYLGLNIALLICYEIEFPEAARNAAQSGAQLILAPTALGHQWGVVAHKILPTRAFENGVYVAYANHAGTEGGIKFLGASCIIDPMGNDLARAGDQAEVISAEVDPAQVQKAQDRLPYLKDRSRLFFM